MSWSKFVFSVSGQLLNGDIEVITMDDLPPSLTVMSPDELQNKVNQEQQDNTGASAILNAVELDSELAGDGEFLKEPGKNSINFLYTFLRTSK